MKSLLLLLMIAVLLCGCGAPGEELPASVPMAEQTAPEVPTEPRGIYVPFTETEARTGGAVRCYQPDLEACYGLRTMGRDILLFSGSQNTTLTRLSGENLFTVARVNLPCRIEPEDPSFQITGHGITYFDTEAGELVFLDNDLKEVSRLGVSSEITGSPMLSSDRMRLYYCTADAVRVYDMQTGLERMIRSVSYPGQTLEAIVRGDEILRVKLTDERGKSVSQFLSAQTGELLREYEGELRLYADEENYFCQLWDGLQRITQFRLGAEEPRVLNPRNREEQIFFLPDSCGVIGISPDAEGTQLFSYDLAEGTCSAELKLPQQLEPRSVSADTEGYVYLLCRDLDADEISILRWDRDRTPSEGDTVCVGLRYTRENPDLEGLEQCRNKAGEISHRYGIRILLGKEAVVREPQGYILEDEYQVGILMDQLERLNACLASFPEGFFDKIPYDKEILLVRSITGKAESGSVAAAEGLQFWDGGTACLALYPGEGMEGAFFHEFFHILDSQILSNSRVYYNWHNLNPEGFAYSEDYSSYLTQDLSAYLHNGDRAFIDAYSTTFPKEDRARIMEYACTVGNEHYFESEIMRSKLQLLCKGIREVFGLEDYPEPLLWEQYLPPQET